MTEIEQRAIELEQKAMKATSNERLSLQPMVDEIVTKLIARGHPVSARLRQLNRSLKEEAIEDMFDNLPV